MSVEPRWAKVDGKAAVRAARAAAGSARESRAAAFSSSSSVAASPNSSASRSRMLASPMPPPVPVWAASPAPVSATHNAIAAPSRVTVTSTRPPCGDGSMPCLIAFSVSVISMPGGITASSRSAGTESDHASRRGKRVCMMPR